MISRTIISRTIISKTMIPQQGAGGRSRPQVERDHGVPARLNPFLIGRRHLDAFNVLDRIRERFFRARSVFSSVIR
jgi:hypothetical protein